MKYVILILFLMSSLSFADVHVNGYYKSNGTYVAPHMRSNPDGIKSNNWSTKGNINPYTLKEGTMPIDHNSNHIIGTYEQKYAINDECNYKIYNQQTTNFDCSSVRPIDNTTYVDMNNKLYFFPLNSSKDFMSTALQKEYKQQMQSKSTFKYESVIPFAAFQALLKTNVAECKKTVHVGLWDNIQYNNVLSCINENQHTFEQVLDHILTTNAKFNTHIMYQDGLK